MDNISIKRRDLLREIAVGTAIIAFDPLEKRWLTAAQAQSTPSINIPDLNGQLISDPASLAAVADDFGHIVRRTPVAILQPGSREDIIKMIAYANQFGIKVAMRGQGHSVFGQSQVKAGVVIDSRPLNSIRDINPGRAVVDAGVTLFDLLNATLARGLTPPVLTDYLGLTVGALSQTGGIGGHTHRFGLFADTVLAVEAVSGTGQTISCSVNKEPDLFNLFVGGLGQFGIVNQVVVPLTPAPPNARVYRLSYTRLDMYLADQNRVLQEGRFSFLEGQIVPSTSGAGWSYLLEAASYYSPSQPPNNDALLGGLSPDLGVEVLEFSYFDWQNRLAPLVAQLQESGTWNFPHPWLNLFLPASQVGPYIDSVVQTLTASEVNGPILLYPFSRSKLTHPFIKTPNEEIIYLFAILRTAEPNPEIVNAMVGANRGLFERARDIGGKSYQVNAFPFSQEDWVRHFDDSWEAFVGLKNSLDPQKLLTPGQGIFVSIT